MDGRSFLVSRPARDKLTSCVNDNTTTTTQRNQQPLTNQQHNTRQQHGTTTRHTIHGTRNTEHGTRHVLFFVILIILVARLMTIATCGKAGGRGLTVFMSFPPVTTLCEHRNSVVCQLACASFANAACTHLVIVSMCTVYACCRSASRALCYLIAKVQTALAKSNFRLDCSWM